MSLKVIAQLEAHVILDVHTWVIVLKPWAMSQPMTAAHPTSLMYVWSV